MISPAEPTTGRAYATLAAGTLSISLAALPVFLFGAMAVLIREDLGFGEVALGAVASAYYTISAVLSIPGGSITERLGGRRAMAVAALITMVAVFGVASSDTYISIFAFMTLAGIANSLALPATNLALARGVPPSRQGLAFGLKQSSGPIATLLAGAALPIIGLRFGWERSFVIAGFAALPLVAMGFKRTEPGSHRVRGQLSAQHKAALFVMALGAMLAVVGGSSLATFYVSSAVASGIEPALAGTLLAVGSIFGIAGRIGWGAIGDRYGDAHVMMLLLIMSLGAVGYVLLGRVDSGAALAVATIVTFTTGWAWPGVFNFAVVMRSPEAPAVATGIIGTGLYSGGIVGPLMFGWIVENYSYLQAWTVVAGCSFLAAWFMYLGGRRLERAAK